MTPFDLYCAIYYALDAAWDETHNEQLGEFLSSANPFLFTGTNSAVPAVYTQFCQIVTVPITPDDSYALAHSYIQTLNQPFLTTAFSAVTPKEWAACVQAVLSQNHSELE